MALAWCAQQPGVTSPIFGIRTLTQLEDNLAAGDMTLDAEPLRRLDEVSKPELVYPCDFHEQVRGMMRQMNLETSN